MHGNGAQVRERGLDALALQRAAQAVAGFVIGIAPPTTRVRASSSIDTQFTMNCACVWRSRAVFEAGACTPPQPECPSTTMCFTREYSARRTPAPPTRRDTCPASRTAARGSRRYAPRTVRPASRRTSVSGSTRLSQHDTTITSGALPFGGELLVVVLVGREVPVLEAAEPVGEMIGKKLHAPQCAFGGEHRLGADFLREPRLQGGELRGGLDGVVARIGSAIGTSALMRPGRALITSTRVARKIASSMSWVTNSTVLRSRSQMPSSSSCIKRAGLVVERAERLVQQQDRGIVGERARDGGALLHAAGELLGVVVRERR